MADLRNDLAKARDAWFESAEGRQVADGRGIGVHADDEFYLRNRLELAFLAGWEARERTEQQRREDKVND